MEGKPRISNFTTEVPARADATASNPATVARQGRVWSSNPGRGSKHGSSGGASLGSPGVGSDHRHGPPSPHRAHASSGLDSGMVTWSRGTPPRRSVSVSPHAESWNGRWSGSSPSSATSSTRSPGASVSGGSAAGSPAASSRVYSPSSMGSVPACHSSTRSSCSGHSPESGSIHVVRFEVSTSLITSPSGRVGGRSATRHETKAHHHIPAPTPRPSIPRRSRGVPFGARTR